MGQHPFDVVMSYVKMTWRSLQAEVNNNKDKAQPHQSLTLSLPEAYHRPH